MYQYRVVNPKILKKMKASVVLEESKIVKRIKYRDDVISGKLPKYEKGSKKKKIAEWAKNKGIVYAECPKCKKPMNSHMAEMQIKNKREGGVECMACIMGWKRK